ncbi:hypothetical protein EA748_08095 [Acinetobacter ursingii]|uniref:hypothetical protein n=1 Tax=Acinetobacter ursingii TaxID=108980 RepID=UPI000F7AF271|nr:hypothetical protein [Acinetobacter ursingii]RSO82902.1 hypothetical protein EA748_08095 [Acinetobacter ursingii]
MTATTVEEWLAQGNKITVIQGFTGIAPKQKFNNREVKLRGRAKPQAQMPRLTEEQAKELSDWLDAKLGRTLDLANYMNCSSTKIGLIKNRKTPCSKTQFEMMKKGMRAIEGVKHERT